jgi:hypothetical protein
MLDYVTKRKKQDKLIHLAMSALLCYTVHATK